MPLSDDTRGHRWPVVIGERGEQLRALLALLVLMVGVRLAWGLFVPPEDFYSLAAQGEF